MPRSPSGDYTLPLPPVISGETIEASWANDTLADIAQAMTDSLSRSNQGNMLQPFLLVDGSKTNPGVAFVNESNTGFYRPAAGDLYLCVLGVDYMRWTDDNGVQIFDGATWYEVVDSNQLQTAVDGLQAQITSNTNDLITAMSFDGFNVVSTRATGDFTVPVNLHPNLRIDGQLRQKLTDYGTGSGTVIVDLANFNRHTVTNNGDFAVEFDFNGLTDPQLGFEYQVEGQIIVRNTASAGTITLSATGTSWVIGEQSLAEGAQILSYFIQETNGTEYFVFVWSSN